VYPRPVIRRQAPQADHSTGATKRIWNFGEVNSDSKPVRNSLADGV
jgi:hypothetical protein